MLDKEMAIAFALRLAAKHHRGAESVIITLKEHWSRTLTTFATTLVIQLHCRIDSQLQDSLMDLIFLYRISLG